MTVLARSANAIGALAYTFGSDITFAAGRYDPTSAVGRHLLAHELAHVVQQRATQPIVARRQAGDEIATMAVIDRLVVAVRFAGDELGPELWKQVKELLSPGALAFMAGLVAPALEIGQLKSVDTSLKSYQGKGLTTVIEKAAGDLAGPGESTWAGSGHSVTIGTNTVRVLDIAIPDVPLTAAQESALADAATGSQRMGVEVRVHRIP